MESLKKNKGRGWVVLLLIVMNIVSLSALWLGHERRAGRGLRGEGPGGRFLEEKLELTSAQGEELKVLRGAHFDRMDQLRKDFHEKRKQFHEQLKAERSPAQVEGLADEIGRLQAGIEKEIYRHFSDIRAICNQDQKVVFDQIIEEVLRRGQQRGGPQQGPPSRRPSGPGGNLPPDGP